MDDVLKDFLDESREGLDQFSQDMVALEGAPDASDLLSRIFRTIHSIKGTCGFLGYAKLESVAHAGESLLSLLREGDLALSRPITDALLAMEDSIREILRNVAEGKGEGGADYSQLIERLNRLQKAAPAEKDWAEVAQPMPEAPRKPGNGKVTLEELGKILIANGAVHSDQVEKALRQQDSGDPRMIGEILVDNGAAQPQDVLQGLTAQKEAKPGSAGDTSIRVGVGLLDKLMNLAGELVLARNQLLQNISTQGNPYLIDASQRLNLITGELQEGIMKTRMQPINNVWSKFPRVVRDLANTCGKEARLEMEGKETELDRTIIEAIKDPLTHALRNSVDHGIEMPGVRLAAGKPAEGCVTLRAFHEGGQVNIEIGDDGAGINAEKVKQRALEKGLITSEQALQMGERQMLNLIFLPGFSTAAKITNVSGRGVGMDVVKTNIEKIGGTVEITTKLGHGTTIRMKIPLTLAIIPALIVESAKQHFAIPQVSLLEVVKLDGGRGTRAIESIHGALVYRLRGKLLPLICLDGELGLPSRWKGDGRSADSESGTIVVLQAESHAFGLLVDRVHDTEEIVVKPLGNQLKGIPVFSGATIRGDGKVALILDIAGLVQKAKLAGETQEEENDTTTTERESQEGKTQLLLVAAGSNRRMAIPMAHVARLEELASEKVEALDGLPVIQYRGEIMPLLWVDETLRGLRAPPEAVAGADARGPIKIVVCKLAGQSLGLVVEKILDVAEVKLEVQKPAGRPGVLGSLVVKQRSVELLDLETVSRMAWPNLFGARNAKAEAILDLIGEED